MRKYTYTENGFTFERIDKKQARRAYNNGLTVEYVDRFTGEKPTAGTMGIMKQYNYKFMEV